jgi:hypothetical protein
LDIPDGIATTIHALYHCVPRLHGPMATLMQCRLEYLPSLHIGPPGPICRVLLRPTKLLPLTQWSTEWPMLEPKGEQVVPESSRVDCRPMRIPPAAGRIRTWASRVLFQAPIHRATVTRLFANILV